MILDHLSNASNYSFANPLLQKGLDFLRSPRAAAMQVGRIELEGDRLFAMMQEYPTREEKDCFWEAHRKYVDIQYICEGVEEIGHAPVGNLKVVQEYEVAKDFMKLEGEGSVMRIEAGMFAVFFPWDGHKPCMVAEGVVSVIRKIVVKVGVTL